jgi:hypothetical protein
MRHLASLVTRSLTGALLVSAALAATVSTPSARALNRNVNAAPESIQECEQAVAKLRESLSYHSDLEQLAKEKKVLLVKSSDGYMPVKVSDVADLLSGELLLGTITSKQLVGILRGLRQQSAIELNYLHDDVTELELKLHQTEEQCQSLKEGGTGSGDLKLMITFQGVTETRDEKTDAESPPQGVTADVQSGNTYGGTVSVAGALPAGDAVYVVFGDTIVAVLGPTGGGFSGVSEPKGFGADTTVGAFVCKQGAAVGQPLPSTGCLAEGDDISAQWSA